MNPNTLQSFLFKTPAPEARKRAGRATTVVSQKGLWWRMLSDRLHGKGITWKGSDTTGSIVVFRRSSSPLPTFSASVPLERIRSSSSFPMIKFRRTSGMLRAVLNDVHSKGNPYYGTLSDKTSKGSVRAIARPAYSAWTADTWTVRSSTLDSIEGDRHQSFIGVSIHGIWVDRSILLPEALMSRTPLTPAVSHDIRQTALTRLVRIFDATNTLLVASLDAAMMEVRVVRDRYSEHLKGK